METIIEKLEENIKSQLVHDLSAYTNNGQQIVEMLLRAYNTYQEEERCGVDYMFNLLSKEDLKCCVDGGLQACHIAHLYDKVKNEKYTPLFFFGVNYESPQPLKTWDDVKIQLVNHLDDIIPCMLSYPESYKELYSHCISDFMINNNLVP